jgi:cytochrome oxidase assembly protein ShyY1
VRAIDSDAIGSAIGQDLLPGYIALTEQVPAADPALQPPAEPDLGKGPHFFYGLQWWFFALLAVIGYLWFAWSEAHPRPQPRRRHPEPGNAPAPPDPPGGTPGPAQSRGVRS